MQETNLKLNFYVGIPIITHDRFLWCKVIFCMHFIVDIATSYDFDMSTTVIMVMPTVGKTVLCIINSYTLH